jgi:predicted dinucleotide-binding enzyme
MKHKIGIVGSGQVAQALAKGFSELGHAVMIGSRDPQKLRAWKTEGKVSMETGSFEETSAFGDVVVWAVKGTVALRLAERLAQPLQAKIVIDSTNPIADAPPQNGVLKYFTDLNESLMEKMQKAVPTARFVKAYSSVGSALMVKPQIRDKPTMFICGNDEQAKELTKGFIEAFGCETADMGKVESARAIEPLAILWCLPGFLHNEWGHGAVDSSATPRTSITNCR